MLIPEYKKEALFLQSILRDAVGLYITNLVNNETTDSLSIELPTTLFGVADTIVTLKVT